MKLVLRLIVASAALWGALLARTSAAQAANTCNYATGNAAHVICWFDFTGYPGTGSDPLTFTLPDGSTLAATLTAGLGVTLTPVAAPSIATAAFGNSGYTGVAGLPVLYTANSAAGAATLSGLTLTDAGAQAIGTFRIVAGDGESTDTGDGTNGQIDWSTTGLNWVDLQLLPSTNHGTASVCTLSTLGLTATCVENTANTPAGAAYLLRSDVTTNESVAMGDVTTSKQGFVFGVDLATLTLAKTITARAVTGDQFTVSASLGTTSVFSATTAGTALTATTPVETVIPGATYTLSESAAPSADLADYASSIACTNATAGSTTTLPSGSGTSFTLTPAYDDRITCTFTNTPSVALSAAKTGPATANVNGLIAYSILVSNAGPAPGDGAAFSDVLPAGSTIEFTPACATTSGAAVCGAVTVTGQTVASTITSLPAGASVTFSINALAAAAASYKNTATITKAAGTSNSTASTSTASSVTTVVAAGSGFSKTVRNVTANATAATTGVAKPGDDLEYALSFTNTTGATISNFAVTDATPANTTFVSASCGPLPAGVTACTITNPAVGGTGAVTFTYTGSLANGAVATFLFDVKVI